MTIGAMWAILYIMLATIFALVGIIIAAAWLQKPFRKRGRP